MVKIKGDKGSILLMSAVLLSVIILIGTMIIVVFFRGYVDVALDIRHEQEKISIQVKAQDIAAILDEENLSEYDITEVDDSYILEVEDDKFLVRLTMDKEFKIIDWYLKEK